MFLRFMQWLLRQACRVFFRNVEVVGLENVPQGAGVIFCGNHPNSLLDPVLIIAFCRRPVHFAAKDTLFGIPVVGFIAKKMGAVPVRRKMDHPDATLNNDDAFAALITVLQRKDAIGIFPEGLSHGETQLQPLKTGAARIGLSAKSKYPEQPIYFIPTGLSYFSRNRFRSSVLVQFGPAIAAPHGESSDKELVRAVTGQIDAGIRGLTVNAESWDTMWVLDGVRRLYQPSDLSLEDRAFLARRFNEVYPTVKNNPDVKVLYDRVAKYLHRVSAVGLDDEQLRHELAPHQLAARAIWHSALLVFWIPLSCLGAPIFAPLAFVCKLLGYRLSPRRDTMATTKFVAGFGLFMVLWLGLMMYVGWRWGLGWGLGAGGLLLLSGYAFIRLLARIVALQQVIQTTRRVFHLRHEIDVLRKERALLEIAVVEAVSRYKPADLQTDTGV